MDINLAALKLKQIEIIEGQIEHLQSESKRKSSDVFPEYSIDCNERVEKLIQKLDEIINRKNE